MLKAEKDRVHCQNIVLQRQLKKHVESGNRAETLLERTKTELVEGELERLRQQFSDLGLEKNEWQRKYEESVGKVEQLMLEIIRFEDKDRELKARVQVLEVEVERATGDKKQVVEGLPGIVKKLFKSCEFAKEMVKVQRHAVNVGGHRSVEKLRGRPGMDVTKLAGYNPEAMEDLRYAGKAFEEVEYEYMNSFRLTRLRSLRDLRPACNPLHQPLPNPVFMVLRLC